MLRDTTNRGLCVRVWSPDTGKGRGGGCGVVDNKIGNEVRAYARMRGQEKRQGHIRRC